MGADDSDERTGWPAELRGITESVVTTRGPSGRWNVAALGLIATDGDESVRARTWGETRTRQNFRDRGAGYIQFTRDPVDFVEAALAVREDPDPVLPSADGWARVRVERVDRGETGGTNWAEWSIEPVESTVVRRVVPTTNRGFHAVVEATVAASRLEVPGYDRTTLSDRLEYAAAVIERCGGRAEEQALERLRELVDWP